MATTKVYGTTQKHLDADVDWVADTIKVSQHTSAYTPNQSTHEYFSSVTNELPTANGYTVGGATLGTKAVTVTSLVTAYKAATTSWPVASGQTLTARYAVVRKDTGTAATSPVLAYVDYATDQTASASGGASTSFDLVWDVTDGVFKVTAA